MGENDEADRWARATGERERREREGGKSLTGEAKLSARRAELGRLGRGEGKGSAGARSWLGRIRPSRGGGESFSFSFLFLISNSFLFLFLLLFIIVSFSFESKIL
jgi:hypothetical protein